MRYPRTKYISDKMRRKSTTVSLRDDERRIFEDLDPLKTNSLSRGVIAAIEILKKIGVAKQRGDYASKK